MTCQFGFISRKALRYGKDCGRRCRRVIKFMGVAYPVCWYHARRVKQELRERRVRSRLMWRNPGPRLHGARDTSCPVQREFRFLAEGSVYEPVESVSRCDC